MSPLEQILNKSDQKMKASWALDCAEHVLFYFEDMFPEDPRPREAIVAGRSWIKDDVQMNDAINASVAAHNAARDVVSTEFSRKDKAPMSEGEGMQAAACATARSASQAAAVIRMEGHALQAATYALKAVSYALGTDEAVKQEREWQYRRLLELTQNK